MFVFDKSTRKPLVNASVRLQDKTGTTDSRGQVSFNLAAPGTYPAFVSMAGYIPFQAPLSFGQYANISDVFLDPAPAAASSPQGTEDLGPVGTSCRLVAVYSGGKMWGKVVHRSGQDITHGYEVPADAAAAGQKDPRCNEVQAPSTETGGLMDAIGDKLEALYDKFAGLEAWLIDHVFDALLAALDRGVKEHERK